MNWITTADGIGPHLNLGQAISLEWTGDDTAEITMQDGTVFSVTAPSLKANLISGVNWFEATTITTVP